jgi:23S rRNA (cytosine1962-C5)-methyltransferase
MSPSVRLQAGRDRSARHRHPWVFSGAVDSVSGSPAPGEIVDVLDARGGFLGRGYYNEHSRIRVRMLTWAPGEIGDALWRERVTAAIRRRGAIVSAGETGRETNAFRLVHAEADLLPGLVVDRYGDVVVVQFLTAGVERVREVVVDAIAAALAPRCIFDRSDSASRAKEGLATSVGAIRGDAPGPVEILENGLRFLVNVESGQKTGFYLDQRENRALVAEHARGRDVLDAFCHTGAFAAYAARAGARSVWLVDSSEASLRTARSNLDRNASEECGREFIAADVFEHLRELRGQGRRFGLVVLDPPKFASNRHQLETALRAYKDISLLAMELLEPEGVLATFSCSQVVDTASFTMAVSWAGVDAGRDVQILRRLGQGPDHPVLASFPESEYLKGLLCRVS